MAQLSVELDGVFEKLGYKGSDLGALGPCQRYMCKERVPFQRFNNGDDAIMATDTEVVALGDVMGQDNSGALANSREDS